jgi:hypothetical protein
MPELTTEPDSTGGKNQKKYIYNSAFIAVHL